MKRLAISVEGETEKEFVKKLLVPHLNKFNVETEPITHGRAKSQSSGGNVRKNSLVEEMYHLSYNFDAVTSLVDFYGFKNKGNFNVCELEYQLLEEIRAKLGERERIIIPYVQLHEFEGLLFSEIEDMIVTLNVSQSKAKKLRKIAQKYKNPEDINDNSTTAPSKRIIAITDYNKRVYGPIIAEKTGLKKIRSKCPRFDNWVGKLENIGTPLKL